MKYIQGSYITGYVTVLVKGKMPELFFQECAKREIIVWNIKKESPDSCKGNVKLGDIPALKKIKRKSTYKLTFIDKKGSPFIISKFLKRKEVIAGLAMAFLLTLFLSNIIWKVEITSVPTDIEEKIIKQLSSYGVHTGAWKFSLDPPSDIQQKLVHDIPELLWVGVHQKGTTYYLEGVEKLVVEEKKEEGPRNLVATKKGVINNIYVSKGIPRVNVNDYVEPGDILVSGEIGSVKENDEEDKDKKDEKDKKENTRSIAAEGEITATTWYETNVTVPLETNYEQLTGNKKNKYYLKIGTVQVPIWGFKKPDYKEIHRETNVQSLNILKWQLPVKIVTSILSEKMYNKIDRSKEEAISHGIQQARKELQLRLGPDAKIQSEKVLHQSIESGKVKLTLYITVEENIAKAEPITQGD
ncbi:sporulation protein YqfD [Virgibacillus byunsanensis]|uniref:Sporulation protein YqfD n=1 Tax=Virgibacillus byunsanensis TaxID=570945 RepID=A0ABW3LM55_9BACI